VEKLVFDPEEMHTLRLYKLVSGTVVPRPIGFVSTQGRNGVPNVAPFSFFNAVSHRPPIVLFSSALREGKEKDTIVNVRETGEFVLNIVSEDIAQQMSASAEDYPTETSEFEVTGLTPVPGVVVKAPMVAESPVNMECKLLQLLPLPESDYTVAFGRVVRIHVASEIYGEEGRIDSERLKAIGRMAGNTYASTRELFTMKYNSFSRITRIK
jgi:flavin reductase (DIM6/NTAB) family NADH-FMN oxidoreductase RutF